jgi:hypothetical protein
MNFKTLLSTCFAVQMTLALRANNLWSVTSAADDGGPSTLRTIVGGSSATDIILIRLTNATITLTSGEIPIFWSLTIRGAGPSKLTIDANKNGRAFNIINGGGAPTVYISGMTIQNGLVVGTPGADGGFGEVGGNGSSAGGGAIQVDGDLFLSNCWFNANAVIGGQGGRGGDNVLGTAYQPTNGGAGGGAGGAAIARVGTIGTFVSAIRCTFSSNTATGGKGGAGGHNFNFAVMNPGGNGGAGGLAGTAAGNFLSLTNCTFSGNQALAGQGGEGGDSDAPTSGGAGGTGGNADTGAFAMNSGGVMVSCTVVSNSAIGGLGGVGGAGSPNGPAGASGTGKIGAISGDTSMGFCVGYMGNCIVANNFASTSLSNLDMLVNDLGFNFIGDNVDPGPCMGPFTRVGTVQSPLDPQLGPLAQNGGGMPTHAPLANSTVIGYGSSLGTTNDERNAARPFGPPIFNSSDGSDIGAVEFGSPPLGGGIGGGGSGSSGGGPNFIVSWPSSYGDFSLQSAPGLSDPSAWSIVPTRPVEIGDQFVVSNSIVGSSMFYRLIRH